MIIRAGLLVLPMVVAVISQEMPVELVRLASSMDCHSVPGFFDRPGMVDPPYLYGFLPGPREQSAAFWCVEGDSPRYRLVIVENSMVTDTIEWSNYPGGLSLAKEAIWALSEFRYVDELTAFGPHGQKTEFAPLWSEYDGAVTMFYRHNGRWLFRMLD